jgi:hypothetical protein
MAAIAATLLAAGTVAALGSNHSAFAHKEYKKKYDNNNKYQYAREDKSGRDGDNIIAAKNSVKCIVVHSDETIGPNSCNAHQDLTNNDGSAPMTTGPPSGGPPGRGPM